MLTGFGESRLRYRAPKCMLHLETVVLAIHMPVSHSMSTNKLLRISSKKFLKLLACFHTKYLEGCPAQLV